MVSYHISHHVTSRHITYHITSHVTSHITSHHMSHHISHHVISYRTVPYHITYHYIIYRISYNIYYNIMVPPSCMRSVVDRNVVMRRIPVIWKIFSETRALVLTHPNPELFVRLMSHILSYEIWFLILKTCSTWCLRASARGPCSRDLARHRNIGWGMAVEVERLVAI